MKTYIKQLIFSVLVLFTLMSCEDVISVDVPRNEEKLVVDGQLFNGVGIQTIKLMVSQAYFDNDSPTPANDAVVKVTDNEGIVCNFTQRLDSLNKPTIFYDWMPAKAQIFGKIDKTYKLEINFKGETYESITTMKRVPKIDSLIYVFKDISKNPGNEADAVTKGFRPEFYARDLNGDGDCYFIKGYKYDNKTKKWEFESQQIAYDAAFSPGSRADGLVFILPIRRSISTKLYLAGDSSKVELYSIHKNHFDFLRAADNEKNNQGLFATPSATFLTNISNKNKSSAKKALGWFSVAGFSKFQTIIDPKMASKDND